MRITARGSLVTATAVVTLAPAGCGGAAATAPATSGGGGSGGGARMDAAQQQKIAQCLQAAGLPAPSFAPRPSRAPGSPPPTRTQGQNRGGGAFADPKVRAALQACGITLPTRPPGPGRPRPRARRARIEAAARSPTPRSARPCRPAASPSPRGLRARVAHRAREVGVGPRQPPVLTFAVPIRPTHRAEMRDSPCRNARLTAPVCPTHRAETRDSPCRSARLTVPRLSPPQASRQHVAEASTARRPAASCRRASAAASRRPPWRTSTSTAIGAPSAATGRTNLTS